MLSSRCRLAGTVLGIAVLASSGTLIAQESQKTTVGPDARQYEEMVAKAAQYLRTKGQADDGSYSKASGPAVTAVVTAGLLRNGRSVDDPVVAKGLKYLEGFVQKDGGIYGGQFYKNYETCLTIMCLVEANKDGRYTKILKDAEKYARGLQWGEDLEDADRKRGGQGYGSKKRPDVSNTSIFIDALRSAGAGEDDPAIREALKFVSQCQNLESEHNTGPFAAKNNDGGFAYTVDDSQAGKTDSGGLRSYGSMTYAGLKSMIFAGVDANDPRVKAATTWVRKNYDLTTNPGMGPQGLYYYYHTFAKALDALGQDIFVDADGKKHDWRRELAEELAKRQRPDGSWVNENNRWLEGDPNLVTGYALLALSYCKPKDVTSKP
jgi:squalene-hopene/tetraprenyl-beta-curcumene cyclase